MNQCKKDKGQIKITFKAQENQVKNLPQIRGEIPTAKFYPNKKMIKSFTIGIGPKQELKIFKINGWILTKKKAIMTSSYNCL